MLWWLIKNYGNNAEGAISGASAPRIPEKREPIDFSKFPVVLNEGIAYKYLRGRGLTKEEIKKYDIRYCNSGRFRSRVLFPVRENGEIAFFTARRFVSWIEPKYRNPALGETPLSVSKVIFGYEEALRDSPPAVVVVEGIFDAIAVNRVPGMRGLAILSSDLSDVQLIKLLRLPSKTQFFVCLDAEARKSTIKIVKTLSNQGRIVRAALLSTGDPASISKEELIKSLKSAERYSHDLESRIFKKNKSLKVKRLQG